MGDSTDSNPEKTKIEKRLSDLTRQAVEIAMGDFETEIPLPDVEDEFTEITTALELMRQDLSRFFTEWTLEKEKVIAAQKKTIHELSTPVIQVWDGILILPLIGTIDTLRAQQTMESLLGSIVRTQAAVAIMDITGVPIVDTTVANHFLKMIAAARMLGTSVIMTGVSTDNAQTLVKLGVDLSGIETKGSLRAGLKAAFSATRNEVVKKDRFCEVT